MRGGDSSNPFHDTGPAPAYPGVGFRLGEYVIKDTLGHGSMATVFLAEDGTGHDVAIKIFQEGPGVSPTMLERFRREAEATKKLRRHPNIMKVYATGKHGPWHYIVMEAILNSRTLEDALENSPMTIEEVVGLMIKIARALHYAHTRSIIHRDVKPANIMVDEFGEPRLSDFGVAELSDMPGVTISGALTGTPLYMSPEQARAEKTGPQSDVYSLGIVLYEALTGVLPYSTQHAAPVRNVLDAVRNETPKRPRLHRKEISRDLEAVILKSIAKEPDRRYADAEAFANDLERAISGRRVTARLFSYWEQVMGLIRRYDQFFVAAVMMVVMAGMAGWFFRQQLLRERYNKLLTDIHLRNFAARVKLGSQPESANEQRGAWDDLRRARRALAENDLSTARKGLNEFIEDCRQRGDQRNLAVAMLDLARCEALAADFKAAAMRFREILQNADAPSSLTDQAQIDALMIALIQRDRKLAMEFLNLRKMPEEGSATQIIKCLSGELDAAKLAAQVESMPPRIRNDACLAAAVRLRLDGDEREYLRQLQRCLQASQPASEWPAPLAKNLRAAERK